MAYSCDWPGQSYMYQQQEILGAGAWGQVRRGKVDCRSVAIKTLIEAIDYTKEEIRDELELWSSLNHRNLVRLHTSIQVNNSHWAVMELMNGGSLRTLLKSKYPSGMPESMIRAALYQVTCAVHYLHSREIMHRDIKPHNILYDTDGIVKLSDFGTVIRCTNNKRDSHEPDAVGTFEYLAPEIFFHPENYSSKIDCWAIGVVMIELAEGNPPNLEMSRWKRAQLLAAGHIPALQTPTAWSADFRSLLLGLLKLEPTERLTALEAKTHWFFNCFQRQAGPTSAELWFARGLEIEPELEIQDLDIWRHEFKTFRKQKGA